MKYTRKDFDTSIGIAQFPGKKKKSLYLQNGNQVITVASFVSNEAGDMFQEVLEQFLGVNKNED